MALNALLVAVGRRLLRDPRPPRRLSDRFGRRPVFVDRAPGSPRSAPLPIFALFDTENAALITLGVVIGWGFAACTMFGAEGVLFAELLPDPGALQRHVARSTSSACSRPAPSRRSSARC